MSHDAMSHELDASGASKGSEGEGLNFAARIQSYVESSLAGADSVEDFDRLARVAFDFQYRRVAPFRRLCDHRGVDPSSLEGWQQIPAVPVMSFRRQSLFSAPWKEVFRSSGTTGGPGERSVHYHPFPELYGSVVELLFPRFCLPGDALPRPVLSLVPARETVPDSSLGFMCDRLLERFGDESSVIAMTSEGLDGRRADAWCERLDDRPGTILTTAFALAHWLEALQRNGRRFRLPAGTTLFETGGFKGKSRELSRDELLSQVEDRLGIPKGSVIREYGMTELTGHFYTDVLKGGDPDLFIVPPFMRVRMLDPETLEEMPPGEEGLVAVFDLSNIGSAIQVVSQDLGIVEAIQPENGYWPGVGFRLLGRADDSLLRGCSLTAEELGTADML